MPAGKRRNAKHALGLEQLEQRSLLSINATGGEPSFAAPTNPETNGHWIIRIAGLDAAELANSSLQGAALKAPGGAVALDLSGKTPDDRLAELFGVTDLSVYTADKIVFERQLGLEGLYSITASPDLGYNSLLPLFKDAPGFQYLEPDYVVHALSTPNDPLYSQLYGLNNTGQTGGTFDADIDAPEAWDISTGSHSIVVGDIDTGLDYNHPDIAANVFTNPLEVPGDGVDNDGNGFVDDVHGWDFVNDDNDPYDDNSHGTHTAGTIGALGDNSVGVVGVNWNVQILPLKFLDAGGTGSTSDAVAALYYAIGLKNEGVNIKMTSNSWGGGGYSQALFDAIDASRQAGMLFIAAAGNASNNNDVNPFYPANYQVDNLISVAATDHNDHLASFSDYGATTVALAAPGVNVVSTVPGGYSSFSGTSMATPHVAGVAALAWSVNPDATYAQVKQAILDGADPVPALNGLVSTGGRLNAFHTLQLMGMNVTSTDPAIGSVVTTTPLDYTIKFSSPYAAASVDASDLTVNGIPATSVSLTDADTLTFHYVVSPVTSQGLQSIQMAAGAVLRDSDGDPLHAFSGQFRYDVLPLAVTSITPPSGSTVTAPLTSLVVDFNEPYDPASVSASDLSVSQGSVSGVSFVDADTVSYALSGVETESPLQVSIAAGALTDVYGNPNLAFAASYQIDVGTRAYPTPLDPKLPAGSLIYDPAISGLINAPGDLDDFTLAVDAGQTISIVVTPDSGLWPVVLLRDPGSAFLGASAGPGAGQDAVLQTIAAPTAGTYTISILGAGGTTGHYSVRVTLNAAIELEQHGGADNGSLLSAQSIDGSFTSLPGGASRGAALGNVAAVGALGSEVEPNDDGIPGASLADLALANDLTGSFFATGPNTYKAQVLGAISQGNDLDWDFFKVHARPGDSLAIAMTGLGLPDTYLWLFDQNGNFLASNDDSNGTLNSFIQYSSFGYDGDYYIAADSYDGWSGTYSLSATLTTSTPPTVPSTDAADLYSFQAGAGQSISLALLGGGAIHPSIELLNSAGTTIAIGAASTGNVDSYIATFLAPASDTYYARVTGVGTAGGINYSLVVTRGAAFNIEPNDSPSESQDISQAGGVLGHVFADILGNHENWYAVAANAGDVVSLQTSTPSDGPFEFVNDLDPAIDVYDPLGNLVGSDDNSASDGRNALLNFTAALGGIYRVRVHAIATQGEYYLRISGSTATGPAPSVVHTDPPDGATLNAINTYTLDFSEGIAPTSVQASDLLVNGIPAVAVSQLDGDTLRFAIDPAAITGDGLYTVTMAGGAVLDLQNVGNLPFSATFTLDMTPPRLVGTAFNGAALSTAHVVSEGVLTFDATFSEDVRAGSAQLPGPNDLLLFNTQTGQAYSAFGTNYNSGSLTFEASFGPLPEALYRLVLFSGGAHINDLVGNALDGDPLGSNPDGTPSGNGTAGGDYFVDFAVDAGVRDLTGLWQRLQPFGSLIYQATSSGVVSFAGDTDPFEFDLDAGQTLTAVATSTTGGDALTLTLFDPGNNPVATATGLPGAPVDLQNAPIATAGHYRLEVGGQTPGQNYSLRLIRNASIEVADTSHGDAQAMDGSLSTIGLDRYAVVGHSQPAVVNLTSVVWGVQPSTGQIVKIDPASGSIIDSFDAPDSLQAGQSRIGLSIAEHGQTLLYVNSDNDPTKLYRLDPVSGAVLSVENLAGTTIDGLGFESGAPAGSNVEPDDYADGTNLAHVNPLVTLSDSVSGYGVFAENAGFPAPTGIRVFGGYWGSSGWNEGSAQLRATFASPVATVSIDAGADDSSDYSVLRAYNSSGVKIGEVFSHQLSTGQKETLTISLGSNSIAYVEAYGVGGDISPMDNLAFSSLGGGSPDEIFLSHRNVEVRRQDGFSGPETPNWATGAAVGAIGGDDHGRQFGFFSDGFIHEFDPNSDTNSFLSTMPAPAADVEGLAFDGNFLFASTASGSLYTLNPNTGAVLRVVSVPDGALFGLGANGAPVPSAIPTGSVQFSIDPGQSSLTLSGDLQGIPIQAQPNGGLTTSLQGTLLPFLTSNSIQFNNSDFVDLTDQAGPFVPFSGPADLAASVNLGGLFANGALRNIAFTSTSQGATPVDFGGNFNANALLFQILSGAHFDYELPPILPPSTTSLAFASAFNQASSPANISFGLGSAHLHIPVFLPFTFTEPISGLTLHLNVDGQINADASVPLPTMPFSLPENDEFTVDLTGKQGQRVDVLLTGLGGADFSSSQLQLIAPDGHTVVATGSSQPLGVDAENYDVGILGVTVPVGGVYTVRLRTGAAGDYSIVVHTASLFDSEPNTQTSDPLRNLNPVDGAAGYLDARPVLPTGNFSFTIDTSQTFVDFGGDVGGLFQLEPQAPGSAHATFAGTINANLSSGAISFPGGSVIDAIAQAGPYLPGNAPADAAVQVPAIQAYAAIRNFVVDILSNSIPVDPSGNFNVLNLEALATSGTLDYQVSIFNGSANLVGLSAFNQTSGPGALQIVGNQLQLTVPIFGVATFTEPTTGLQVHVSLTGRLVGLAPAPQPLDGGDLYTYNFQAGQEVEFDTTTPLDGLDTQNLLDPRLVIYDSFGNPVASDDNSAPDGKNAHLAFTAPAAGQYFVQVLGSGVGEYHLLTHTTFVPPAPPKVVDVLVSSTNWTPTFLQTLANQGLGVGGYSIPVGSGVQLNSLPWGNIDQIKIVFSEDVSIQQDDLSLLGLSVPSYAFSGFSYDASTFTATWTLPGAISNDNLLLVLDGFTASGVVDINDGLKLDGLWDNPVNVNDLASSTYPSGLGFPGTNFMFRMNVLPGDINQDGVVSGADYAVWAMNYRMWNGNATFVQGDISGDGEVTGVDYAYWAQHLQSVLPSPATGGSWLDALAAAVYEAGRQQLQNSRAASPISLSPEVRPASSPLSGVSLTQDPSWESLVDQVYGHSNATSLVDDPADYLCDPSASGRTRRS
jgi:subtilisin family serine protease